VHLPSFRGARPAHPSQKSPSTSLHSPFASGLSSRCARLQRARLLGGTPSSRSKLGGRRSSQESRPRSARGGTVSRGGVVEQHVNGQRQSERQIRPMSSCPQLYAGLSSRASSSCQKRHNRKNRRSVFMRNARKYECAQCAHGGCEDVLPRKGAASKGAQRTSSPSLAAVAS
jgi:hypothetical protein